MSNPTTETTPQTEQPKRTYRSKAEWFKLIQQFENSDLTIDEYCLQQNISSSGFYAWKKRFQQQSSSESAHQPTFVDISPAQPITPTSPAEPDANSLWHVELTLGPGCTLRLRRA